ncbi:hypothetical protein ACFQZZ_28705 [Nocardia sp. GCM10030253]|uniref:hypothetical protein n=1 Tax=Nocardia sp. GCM10030253 TaxID=3273404 RepID=UPI00363C2AF5
MSTPTPPEPYRGYAQSAPHAESQQPQGNPAMGIPNPYAPSPGYPPPNPYAPAAPGYPPRNSYSPGPGFPPSNRPAGSGIDRVAGILLLITAIITGGWRLLASFGFHWNDVPLALMIVIAISAAIVMLTGAAARIPALRALAAAGAGMLLATSSSELALRSELSFLFEDHGWLSIPATIAALAATITAVLAANSTHPRAAQPPQFPTQWQQPTSGPPQAQANPYPLQTPWPPQ